MDLKTIIATARGDAPADLLLTNARIVNVFSGRIVQGSVAIKDGTIVGFGDHDAAEIVDLEGRYLAPGFIDAHVHIESSMACISEFARAVAPCGTTTVVADPHEIANVLGAAGIEYMLRSAEGQPMDCLFALPSCVPATDMETAGARLGAERPGTLFRPYAHRCPGRDDELPRRHFRRCGCIGQAEPGPQPPPGHGRPRSGRRRIATACLYGRRHRFGPRMHPRRRGPGKTGAGHAHHGARGYLRPQSGGPVSRSSASIPGAV